MKRYIDWMDGRARLIGWMNGIANGIGFWIGASERILLLEQSAPALREYCKHNNTVDRDGGGGLSPIMTDDDDDCGATTTSIDRR